MEKLQIYNLEGQAVKQVEMPVFFSQPVNHSLIHRYMVWARTVIRDTIAHTKTRGEISGGGKKPYKQKGTGRARSGSSRNPIWRHGGVIFGPRNTQNFATRMPRTERRKALFSALSSKAATNRVLVLDTLPETALKTKDASVLLTTLPVVNECKKVIFVTPHYDEPLTKSLRNLPGVVVKSVSRLNILDLLSHDCLVMSEVGLEAMTEQFSIKL